MRVWEGKRSPTAGPICRLARGNELRAGSGSVCCDGDSPGRENRTDSWIFAGELDGGWQPSRPMARMPTSVTGPFLPQAMHAGEHISSYGRFERARRELLRDSIPYSWLKASASRVRDTRQGACLQPAGCLAWGLYFGVLGKISFAYTR